MSSTQLSARQQLSMTSNSYAFYSECVDRIFTHPIFYTSRSFDCTRGRLGTKAESHFGQAGPTFGVVDAATCHATRQRRNADCLLGAGASVEKGNARTDLNVCGATTLILQFSLFLKMRKKINIKALQTTPVEQSITV